LILTLSPENAKLVYVCLLALFSIYVATINLFVTSTNIGRIHKNGVAALFGIVLILLFVYIIGLRTLSTEYGDMINYYRLFTQAGDFNNAVGAKDPFFYVIIHFMTRFVTVEFIFLLIALAYILASVVVAVKESRRDWFLLFALLTCHFSFWAYGVNGIRHGLAAAIFMLAFYISSDWKRALLILISISFHVSMVIPALGLMFYKIGISIKSLFIFWVFSIPVGLLGSQFFIDVLETTFAFSDRVSYFDSSQFVGHFSESGFRWDFLIYSASSLLPAYYIYLKNRREISSSLRDIFAVFIFSNAVWLLLIDVNFSNRFAYLSWFLIGFIYYIFVEGLTKRIYKYVAFILIITVNLLLTYIL